MAWWTGAASVAGIAGVAYVTFATVSFTEMKKKAERRGVIEKKVRLKSMKEKNGQRKGRSDTK